MDSPYKYLKLGIVHFMAYPEVLKEGPVLESFDRDIDKKCLIDPVEDAVKVARRVRSEYKNFELMFDKEEIEYV